MTKWILTKPCGVRDVELEASEFHSGTFRRCFRANNWPYTFYVEAIYKDCSRDPFKRCFDTEMDALLALRGWAEKQLKQSEKRVKTWNERLAELDSKIEEKEI